MMGMLASALSAQRQMKRAWRRLKPWLPLLFWLALLVPLLVHYKEWLLLHAPWRWVSATFAGAALNRVPPEAQPSL